MDKSGWRLKFLIGIGVTLVGVFALACGPRAEPTPAAPQPTVPPAAPAATATPVQPAAPAPAPTAAPGEVAAPAPIRVEQAGAVVLAQNVVNPMIGDPSIAPYRDWEQSRRVGITEALFVMENDDPMWPHLASFWEVVPDGSKAIIGVRQGIKFNAPVGVNRDFGELTAHDVVWFINRQNAYTNPESTSGDAGDFAAVLKEAVVIDDYTLEIGLQTPTYFGLPLSEFGILGAAASIRSQKAFEMMGVDWVRDWAVGTGPMVQKEWVNNERGVVEAMPEHWKEPATIKTMTYLQVPENSSRIAMVRTGQADMAIVDFKLVPQLIQEPNLKWIWTMPGDYVGISVIYSGNLWEEFHALSGEPLEPWKSPAYARHYPWIGNPWGNRAPTGETGIPAGMDSMERARLVRLALGMAIDREGINEVLMGGMGTIISTEYMGPEYPGWDPDRIAPPMRYDTGEVITNPGPTQKPVPWMPEFDPDGAKALLATAGYPNGFSITLQSYVCEIGEVCLEAADFITSQWTAIGLNIVQKREDYGAVISPRMRAREQFDPVLKNGDVHSNNFPIDWPYPPVDSSLSRPGWGVGFETPYLANVHVDIRGSRDREYRIEKHLETVDYMTYWQLYNGVVQIPKGVLANQRIASWSGRAEHYGNTGSPQHIRLAQ